MSYNIYIEIPDKEECFAVKDIHDDMQYKASNSWMICEDIVFVVHAR